MKNKSLIIIFVILLLVIAIATVLYPKLSDDYQTNDQAGTEETIAAPDIRVTDANGNTVYLSDFVGKPVIVNFWASWCGPCESELPEFEEAYLEYGEEIEFMMVNLTASQRIGESGVKDYIEEKGYTFPVYFDLDGEAEKSYDLSAIPVSIFIDAEGNIQDTKLGSMNKKTLYNYISNLLEGEEI